MHKLELEEENTQTIAHKNIEPVEQFSVKFQSPSNSSPHSQRRETLGTNAG